MGLPDKIQVVTAKDGKPVVGELPPPKLRDDYVLVKVNAVGLNPTDWKHAAGGGGYDAAGLRIGCDYAGIVEEVGSKVNKKWQKGDRITGVVHGANGDNNEDGAFAEYIVAKGDLQIKIPDNIKDTDAATLGISVTTCGQALYQSLKLPMPDQPSKTPIPLLIYGGSTGTGILAIQYAKLSGCTVVTTSSPHNFDYLKSLGADATFDYNSPSVVDDIKAYTKGQLKHALDCISTESSMKITVGAFSDEGGMYSTLQPVPDDKVKAVNSKVRSNMTLAYTAIGEGFKKFGAETPANPENYEFAKEFWELTRQLLANGKLKPARTKINEGGAGLQGVVKGLDDLKNGRVSGAKLVYTL